MEERIYLGGYEVYRKYISGTLSIERTTVHVADDSGRIAMLEVLTQGADGSAASLVRYIYSNHLSTASLELDDSANIISYEEYHPYGTTSYQAMNATINAVAKRYRYTGKERDEETGLYYIGARYYAPWLTRWIAADPINYDWYNLLQGQPGRNTERQFVELTACTYEYCYANPVRFIDPTGEQVSPQTTPTTPAPSSGSNAHTVPVTITDKSGNVTHTTAKDEKNVIAVFIKQKPDEVASWFENDKKGDTGVHSVSQKGKELLMNYEQGPKHDGGPALRVYDTKQPDRVVSFNKKGDPLTKEGNVDYKTDWTIGYGHKVLPGEDFSKGINTDQANKLFEKDLSEKSVDIVNKNITVPLTQNQFDALSLYVYNVGSIGPNLTINLNKGDYKGALKEMNVVTVNHEFSEGLQLRRDTEHDIWTNGIYNRHEPERKIRKK